MQFGQNGHVKGTLEAIGSVDRKLSFKRKLGLALKDYRNRPFKYVHDRRGFVRQNSAQSLSDGSISLKPSVADDVDQPFGRNPSRSITIETKKV